jgi:hypothetical protein
VLGASLLAAASIVFLLFSWGWIPLAGRAVAIAAGTVVVFGLASRLRRSGLTSSAEAVGGLAAVLLLLDAWAVPATGLLRLTEPAVYAAVAALVCGALLGAWSHLSHLRVGTLAAAVLVPVAPLLLAPLAPGGALLAWLACTSSALSALRFPVSAHDGGRRAEHLVLATLAWLVTAAGTVAALGGALVDGERWGLPAPGAAASGAALAGLGATAAVHGMLAARTRVAEVTSAGLDPDAEHPVGALPHATPEPGGALAWLTAAGVLAALTAPVLVLVLVRESVLAGSLVWALVPVAACAVAATLTLVAARVPASSWSARGARAVAFAVSAPTVAALPVLAAARLLTGDGPQDGTVLVAATVGAAAAVGLSALAPRTWAVGAWVACAVLLAVPVAIRAAVPRLGDAALVGLVLALGALAAVADRRGARLRTPSSVHLRVVAVLAVLAAVPACRGREPLLAVALAGLGALVLVVRTWAPGRPVERALALAGSVLLTWSAAVVALIAGGIGLGTAVGSSASVVVSVASVLAVRRVVEATGSDGARTLGARADRLAWLAVATVVLVVAWPIVATEAAAVATGPGAALAVLLGGVATLAATLVARRGAGVPTGRARVAAAALVAPLGALTIACTQLVPGARVVTPALAAGLAGVGAAVVLLAGVLAATTGPRSPRTAGAGEHPGADAPEPGVRVRGAAETGGWGAIAGALVVALTGSSSQVPAGAALVLLVAAVTAEAWSFAPGRRWARWCGLALAVVASWVLLGARDVGTPEAYLTPVGLVLTAVGVRRWWRSADGDLPLVGAGLALVALPTALLGGTLMGAVPRVAVTLVTAAVLVGVAHLPAVRRAGADEQGPGGLRTVHLLPLLGVLVAALGPARHAALAATLAAGTAPAAGALRVEAWSLPAAALVALGVAWLARDRTADRVAAATWGPWAVALVGAGPTLLAVDDSRAGLLRAAAVLVAGALVALRRGGLTRAGEVGVGTATATGATLAAATTLTAVPAEVSLGALGALVLVTGALRALSSGRARPWAPLGTVLLVPLVLGPGTGTSTAGLVLSATLVGWATWLARRSSTSAGGRAVDATLLLLGSGVALALLGSVRHALIAALGPDAATGASAVARVEAWSLAGALVVTFAVRALVRDLGARRPADTDDAGEHEGPDARRAEAGLAGALAAARRLGTWVVAGAAVLPTAVAVTVHGAAGLGLARSAVLVAAGAALAGVGASPVAPPRRVLSTSLVHVGLSAATIGALAAVVAPRTVPGQVVLGVLGAVVTAVGTTWLVRTGRGDRWPFAGPALVLPLVIDVPAGGAPVALAVVGAFLAAGLALTPTDARARGRAVLLTGVVALGTVGPARLAWDSAHGPNPTLRTVEAVSLASALLVAVAVHALARRWPFSLPAPRVWGVGTVAVLATVPTLTAALTDAHDLARPGAVFGAGAVLALVAARGAARAHARAAGDADGTTGDDGVDMDVATGAAATPLVTTGSAARGPFVRLPRHARPGARQLTVVGLVLASAAAAVTTVRGGAVPLDAPLVALGVLVLAVGWLALSGDDERRSWPTLSPGLVLALLVPLVTGWSEPTMWRLVLVLLGGTAAVVVGAVRRWQAPFVLGAGALVVVAVVQVSPAAVAAVELIEWWVVLALGGAVLLGLGLTYERRLREAREAVRFVAAMR